MQGIGIDPEEVRAFVNRKIDGGLRLKDIAHQAGVDVRPLGRFLKGETKRPSLPDLIIPLCAYFDINQKKNRLLGELAKVLRLRESEATAQDICGLYHCLRQSFQDPRTFNLSVVKIWGGKSGICRYAHTYVSANDHGQKLKENFVGIAVVLSERVYLIADKLARAKRKLHFSIFDRPDHRHAPMEGMTMTTEMRSQDIMAAKAQLLFVGTELKKEAVEAALAKCGQTIRAPFNILGVARVEQEPEENPLRISRAAK